MAHIRFPSIESFRHVVKFVRERCDYHGWPYPTFTFLGDVKLHGTNAGVRLEGDKLIAQSRERDITVNSDNAGFAAFVERNADAIREYMIDNGYFLIYGEWIGPGIQKRVALNQLPERHFAVFAARVPSDRRLRKFTGMFDVFTENGWTFHEIKGEKVTVDFNAPEAAAPILEELTSRYESECPYGKHFGVSGVGEGLVWKPAGLASDEKWNDPETLDRLMFKTKGLAHCANKSKVKVAVSAERVADFNALVERILPAWRLEQGLSWMRELGIKVAKCNTGEYLKWIAKDVLKEEQDYIAASGFDEKAVMQEISTKARVFYFKHTED